MLDQLIIGTKASFDEFGASVARRTISQPTKKIIKETIPFSNITYDFSGINGELYWDERKLEYVFEITAQTPQALEELKKAFASWIMNTVSEKIFDPFIAGYHFVGTFESMEFDDEEHEEKTTATVIFSAYPYKISNEEVVCKQILGPAERADIIIVNTSSHRISPTITVDAACSISFGDVVYTIPAGTYTGDELWLVVGENTFEVSNPSNSIQCTVAISFYEEVF